MNSILLKAEAVKGGKIRLSTSNPRIRTKTVQVFSSQEAFAELRMYKAALIRGGAVSGFDVRMPNMWRVFNEANALRTPPPKLKPVFCTFCGKAIGEDEKTSLKAMAHEECEKGINHFETNMVEALVGWKGWSMEVPKDGKPLPLLKTRDNCVWQTDVATEASCVSNCGLVPSEKHTCGIYAADKKESAYGGIRGEIYGWGRYIRGSDGWRSQYAYPKNFVLNESDVQFVEALKQYHVPIFITQPIQIYDPAEDGFEGEEDEYRKYEAERHSGTDEEPDPEEEGDEAGED